MKKISIIILLMICLSSLLLTGCEEVGITPEINSGNSEYQGDTEDPGTGEVDTTKPVITGSPAPLPNSLGWNNTDVTVSFSCADTGAVQSGIDINTVAGATLTTEGKDQSVTNTGTCIDVAGNTADPVTVSNINIDKTPPVVTFTFPGTGKYVLNQSITTTWSATDALSGLVSPVSGSVLIDTSSVGTKTFTLLAGTATDKAGNSSLKVTISYSVIEDTEDSGTENPQKWSGLGMGLFYQQASDIDTLLANGFTELRIDIPDYQNTWWLVDSKAAVISVVAKGAKAIWGVSSNSYNNVDYTITAENWSTFRQAILDAAQWAQDNGIYEFQLGNEEELHIDRTTMTVAQIIINLKSVATDVKAIFTNGNVSYSCWQGSIDNWITAGKGDIDILASNIYMGGDGYYENDWKTEIDNLVDAFGADGTYLTEFAPSWSSLDNYSTDEAVQAEALTEMIDYIKASGIERALFYAWLGYEFGVLKDDGTYRLLWNQALLNSGSVKSITVPVKTATISLPDTIALIP